MILYKYNIDDPTTLHPEERQRLEAKGYPPTSYPLLSATIFFSKSYQPYGIHSAGRRW